VTEDRSEPAWMRDAIRASAATIADLEAQLGAIDAVAGCVVNALRSGHKVLTAGNGGSAAEALHMAEELVGRFRADRPSLPGISLAADSTALTCIGNDYGYERVFSRQVEGLGIEGDVLVLFSTSGTAGNLATALDVAHGKGMTSVCILGRDGGPMAGRGHHEVIVHGDATERIQEAHQVVLHLVLDAVERTFADT
jgi:D-sedoheptulose 7-phosphate isomerase